MGVNAGCLLAIAAVGQAGGNPRGYLGNEPLHDAP